MAEILGAVSSIAGLADVSAKVAIGLFNLAQAIGSAGQEIRAIAHSTKLISGVLSNLNSVMTGEGRPAKPSSSLRGDILVEDAINHCRPILADCESVVEIFQPLICKTGRRRERALLRLRMLFERSRLLQHRDKLDKLIGVLTLHVTVLNFTHVTMLNVPEETSTSFRIQVESSIATVNDTCQERSKITQLLEYHGPYIQGLLLPGVTSNPIKKSEHLAPSLIEFDDIEPKSSTVEPSPATTATQDMLNQQSDGPIPLTRTNSLFVDEDCMEDISRNPDAWAAHHDGDDTDSILEMELDLKLEERFASTDLDELFECYLEIKTLQKKTVQFAEQVLHTKQAEEDMGSENDEFADAIETIEDKEKEEVGFNDDVLRLRDVHGQIYNLPFDVVKTWEGMNQALILIYEHSPEYINYHSRGRRSHFEGHRTYGESHLNTAQDTTLRPFQLYGPDGYAILTEVWSLVIEPGDLITMRFRNEKLNGVGAHPVTVTERSMGWLRSWWSQKDSVGINKRIPRDRQTSIKLARGPKAIADWLAETGSVVREIRGRRGSSVSESSYFTN
ncbi:hypothetical protein N431DRAFT_481376 [Stipitochalara longipes BDJ]|nr:hypothetical protein N431DRAFT_481376 [Stipitochalara longipes BDJ]